LIGRDEGPIGALLQQGLQGGSIGLSISILLLQQVKALLQHSTHGWEATSFHKGFGKGMLIFAERHRTLDDHLSSIHRPSQV
jgi:hypothetical protein